MGHIAIVMFTINIFFGNIKFYCSHSWLCFTAPLLSLSLSLIVYRGGREGGDSFNFVRNEVVVFVHCL